MLDTVKAGGQVPEKDFTTVFSRISFFVNAGVRFVTEMCKMRAFVDLWEEIGRERYGVTDTRALMFRYGVQVNSLGLTEPQPENNVYRILIEALAVTLSKRARCRALQLPAWNEALGLPRPWDQQWSLRLQQILAYETDLLEYEDLFDGSHVVTAKTEALKDQAREMLAKLDAVRRHDRQYRLHEDGAGRKPARAPQGDRGGAADRRRRQPLRDDGSLAAVGRRWLDHGDGSWRGEPPDREAESLARAAQ